MTKGVERRRGHRVGHLLLSVDPLLESSPAQAQSELVIAAPVAWPGLSSPRYPSIPESVVVIAFFPKSAAFEQTNSAVSLSPSVCLHLSM